MRKNSVARFLGACVFAFVAASCSAPKDVAYFQDMKETVIPLTQTAKEITVRPHDKLSIIIKSKDPELSGLFNLNVASSRVGLDSPVSGTGSTFRSYTSTSEGISVYTVNAKGDIDFPVLGMLHIEGMTRGDLAGFIKGELMGKELVKDPVVTVEFINVGFSVMGEVANPGRFDINADQLNLLEALSLAGDLTIQGQRDNVAVMREGKDGVQTYRVDLTNFTELTKSPAYYIQQGDIIYVEPNGVKKRQTTVNGNNVLSASFWVSVASLLTSVAVLIFK